MVRGRWLICLVVLLNGCGSVGVPATGSASQATASLAAQSTPFPMELHPVAQTQVAGICPVSDLINDTPPKDPHADPFGDGPWYRNADRTIWAGSPGDTGWRAGAGEKVIWIRPEGTELHISGRRLDVEGPPLHADIPDGYFTGFQVTGLTFPTQGCWEVRATAGTNELRFVTKIMP